MEKTNIIIDDHRVGSARITTNNVTAFGAPQSPYLRIPVELQLNPIGMKNGANIEYSILNMKAKLFTQDSNIMISKSDVDQISEHRIKHKFDYPCYFDFPLNMFKVNLLENVRAKDLKLELQFTIHFSIFRDGNLSDFRNYKHRLKPSIPQSHWIDNVLPKLGHTQYFLIEIPKGRKTMPEIWNKLEQAEVLFSQLDISSLFQKCREIGSSLETHLKKNLGKDSFSYKERWSRSYNNFSHFCSLALHIEELKGKSQNYEIDEIKLTKLDCVHILLKTKALIKYAEELLAEKSTR